MSAAVFKGMMPALMTPCLPDRTPDFDALVRKGKEMMEAGMSAVIYAGSMGDWPLLTDAQRMEGVERLVAAGIPVVVGTGAINSASATALAAHAQNVGAAGLMVIPRVLSRVPTLRPGGGGGLRRHPCSGGLDWAALEERRVAPPPTRNRVVLCR